MKLVHVLLRLEGAAIFAAATWAYLTYGYGSVVLFIALILLPDLALVGYLRDTRWGAWTYNLVHNEALPVALLVGGLAGGSGALAAAGLLLGAHVGMDRACGFGLKLPERFNDTHLQRLGFAPPV